VVSAQPAHRAILLVGDAPYYSRFGFSATAIRLIVFWVFCADRAFWALAFRPFLTALVRFICQHYTYISIHTPLEVQMFQLEHSAHMFQSEHSLDFTAPPRFVTPGLSIVPPALWGGVRRSARRRLSLLIGKSCRLFKYLHKHFSRELAGLRVLVRRMVRGQ